MTKAAHIEELHALVSRIENLDKEQSWKFISQIHSIKLMKITPAELSDPMITKEMFDKIVNGADPAAYDVLFSGISKTMPDEIENFIQQTCQHIMFGNDTEDENSAGGFSQREINLIDGILERLR